MLGVDISKVILDNARARQTNITNLHFELGDAASFEFEPGYFDLFTSRFGVMFFEEPIEGFRNLRRALKSDARTAFVCWRGLEENPWMAAPAAAAFEILPRPEPPAAGAPGPFALADASGLTKLLESAGFGAVHIEPVDELMNMGAVDVSLDFLSRMGPAATALQEASETDAQAATAAMKKVLSGYVSNDAVRMLGAVWLVRANVA